MFSLSAVTGKLTEVYNILSASRINDYWSDLWSTITVSLTVWTMDFLKVCGHKDLETPPDDILENSASIKQLNHTAGDNLLYMLVIIIKSQEDIKTNHALARLT